MAQIRKLCDPVWKKKKKPLNLEVDRYGFNSYLDHLLADLRQVFEFPSFISLIFKIGIIITHQATVRIRIKLRKKVTFNVLHKLQGSIKM